MAVTFNGVPGFATPGVFVPGKPLTQAPIPPPGPPPVIPTSGGDRGYTIRVFREIRPGDVPASGAQLPKLTGRAFLVPVASDVEHATHVWEVDVPEPPGQAKEQVIDLRAVGDQLQKALELARIFADPPYQRQAKRCGAIRMVGGVMLTCGRRPGHDGKHSARGLDWR